MTPNASFILSVQCVRPALDPLLSQGNALKSGLRVAQPSPRRKESMMAARSIILSCFIFAFASCISKPTYVNSNPAVKNEQHSPGDFSDEIVRNSERMLTEGREIFRHDTFGSEDFWSNRLHLNQAIAG